jgi:hypothetical protein
LENRSEIKANDLRVASTRTLSKSDFKLARTCDAKLYFRENSYPDTRDSNPYLALLAEGGYMVEALAKAKHRDGIQLDYRRGTSVADAYAHTIEHLNKQDVTLFEATLLLGRRQARVDILEKKGTTVRLLEVKAKSFDGDGHVASLKRGEKGVLRQVKKPFRLRAEWIEKFEDITFQTIILERLRPDLTVKPYLVLVDTSKRSGLDNVPGLFDLVVESKPDGKDRVQTARFSGAPELLEQLDLVTEVDVSEEVEMLREEIELAAERYEALLDAPLAEYLKTVERTSSCRDCEFRVEDEIQPNGFIDCWGPLAKPKPHVLELYKAGQAKLPDKTPLVEAMLARGTTALLDVPTDCFDCDPAKPGSNGNRQLRQIEHTRSGTNYIAQELRTGVVDIERRSQAGEKLFFIDFVTCRLSLPYV